MKSRMTFLLLVSMAFATAANAEPVDINCDSAEALAAQLQGVGETRAAAIVEHRNQVGKFASADDLLAVKGIGSKTLDANRDNIEVGESCN